MKKVRKSKKFTGRHLLESFRPLFWSYRFSDLDVMEDSTLIIKQILAYGNLTEWRWMIRTYGNRKIKAVLSKTPQTELRPSLVELSKTVFGVTSMPYARRVPHQRS